jgi:hypothetical protein
MANCLRNALAQRSLSANLVTTIGTMGGSDHLSSAKDEQGAPRTLDGDSIQLGMTMPINREDPSGGSLHGSANLGQANHQQELLILHVML